MKYIVRFKYKHCSSSFTNEGQSFSMNIGRLFAYLFMNLLMFTKIHPVGNMSGLIKNHKRKVSVGNGVILNGALIH